MIAPDAEAQPILRVAIADDEPLARMRLRRLLGAEPDLQIVWECADGAALVESLTEQAVDAVFLDIEMPEMDGFGTMRTLAQNKQLQLPMVVFCTAFEQYAPRAFDIDAVDYLLKPVQSTRLSESLERLRRQKRLSETAPPGSEFPEHLSLPIGRRMHRVAVAAISVVLAQANYLEVRAEGRSFVLRQTLANFSKQLDPSAFVRVHRSCVIRIGAVESVESVGSGRYRLRLRDGSIHYAARGYREALRSAFALTDHAVQI